MLSVLTLLMVTQVWAYRSKSEEMFKGTRVMTVSSHAAKLLFGQLYLDATGIETELTFEIDTYDDVMPGVESSEYVYGVTEEKISSNVSDIIFVPYMLYAITPCVHLPDYRDHYNVPLSFSISTIVDIFMGEITRWDDPVLQQENKNFKWFPKNETITVLYFEGPETYIFGNALSIMSPKWASVWFAEPRDNHQHNWPKALKKLPNVVGMAGPFDMASTLENLPSLGFLHLEFAPYSQDTIMVGIKNSKGVDIFPNQTTIRSAYVNTNVIPPDLETGFMNKGNNAYPIVGINYVVARKTTTPSNRCLHIRAALELLYYFVTQSALEYIINDSGYVIPGGALTQNSLKQFLSVSCNGDQTLADLETYQNDTAVFYAFLALAMAGAFVLLLIPVPLLIWRRSAVFKSIGWTFLGITFLGGMLSYFAAFMWYLTPNEDWICGCRVWFLGVGWALIFGALISKSLNTYLYIRSIETMDVSKVVYFPEWKIVVFALIPVAIEIVLLILWQAIDPWESRKTYPFNQHFEIAYDCHARDEFWHFGGPQLALAIITFLVALYVTYRGRTLGINYRECWLFLLALYNFAIITAVVIPLLAALDINDETIYFLACIAMLIPTTSFLWAHYFYKLVFLFQRDDREPYDE